MNTGDAQVVAQTITGTSTDGASAALKGPSGLREYLTKDERYTFDSDGGFYAINNVLFELRDDMKREDGASGPYQATHVTLGGGWGGMVTSERDLPVQSSVDIKLLRLLCAMSPCARVAAVQDWAGLQAACIELNPATVRGRTMVLMRAQFALYRDGRIGQCRCLLEPRGAPVSAANPREYVYLAM